ncbi:vWA domain-containing protein, partial [Singulisphaera rosea]
MYAIRFESMFWLILAPLAIGVLWWRRRARRRPSAVFSSVGDLRDLPVTLAQRIRRTLPYVYAVGLCLVIGALARPRAGRAETRISGEGIAIEVVLDVSGSMQAMDFQLDDKEVNRLEAVKHVVREFVLGSRE